ncbi:MAG: hypothetical protein R3288_12750 [Woeseiaceae bacterium]|nr:hypothetical protein [Woeseiaceae bacterium]
MTRAASSPVNCLSCWLLVAVIAVTGAAQPAHAQSTFARVVEDDGRPRALQIAIVSYENPARRRSARVDLIGAVHIGDEAYYAALNERFRRYDAVLFELVAPQGTIITPDTEITGFLSGTQRMMTRMLDLSFQLEKIDYTLPNFVHADLSPDEMSASMAERNESLYTYFWRIFIAAMREYSRDPLGMRNYERMDSALSAGSENSLKVMMAYDFADLDRYRHMLGNDADNAVIGARNQRAIDVLLQQLQNGSRRIGIFYGLAHMPDFEDKLAALGYEPVDVDWVDAWALTATP